MTASLLRNVVFGSSVDAKLARKCPLWLRDELTCELMKFAKSFAKHFRLLRENFPNLAWKAGEKRVPNRSLLRKKPS